MRLSGVMQPPITLTLVLSCAAACAGRRPWSAPDIGINACPVRAASDLLSIDALQCWFSAPHGRWRTLSHESHFAVLVVQVETGDLRDAASIARRFVASEREMFSEILVYAQRERPSEHGIIRRVRWTQDTGFEILDFARIPNPEPQV